MIWDYLIITVKKSEHHSDFFRIEIQLLNIKVKNDYFQKFFWQLYPFCQTINQPFVKHTPSAETLNKLLLFKF